MKLMIDFEDSTSTRYNDVVKIEMTESELQLRLRDGKIVSYPKKDVAAMYTFNRTER